MQSRILKDTQQLFSPYRKDYSIEPWFLRSLIWALNHNLFNQWSLLGQSGAYQFPQHFFWWKGNIVLQFGSEMSCRGLCAKGLVPRASGFRDVVLRKGWIRRVLTLSMGQPTNRSIIWWVIGKKGLLEGGTYWAPFPGVMSGSKMVSASWVVQVAKPHTPLIRFPDRRDNPTPSVSEALKSAGIPSHSTVISQHSKGCQAPELLMHPGPPDTAEIIKSAASEIQKETSISKGNGAYSVWRSRIMIVPAICHQTKELSL